MNRLVLALAAGAITTSAQAAVINTYTDEASFLAAAGSVVSETFDPFFAVNGATAIAGNNVQTSVGAFSVSQNGGGSGVGVFDPKVYDGPSANDYEIDAAGPAYLQLRSERSPVLHFSSSIRAFGATFNSISSAAPTLTVAGSSYNLYDILGAAPASFASPAQDGGFFGFILDAPVSSITISSQGADTFALDTAHISAVPLPAGILLLATGLGGAACLGRRKRQT
jgi:hypothetical protein